MKATSALNPEQNKTREASAWNTLLWADACCEHARQAVECGRLSAARCLYQTACSLHRTSSSLADSDSLMEQVQRVEAQLEGCAAFIQQHECSTNTGQSAGSIAENPRTV